MLSTFSHFDASLFQFLRELKNNNNKVWFAENKRRYENDVVEPMLQFIAASSGIVAKLSREFSVIPKQSGGSLFRIYRDARFSKNKIPFKTYVACCFWHGPVKNVHAPCFYMELDADKFYLGAGLWMPEKDDLQAVRSYIASKPKDWAAIVEKAEASTLFKGIVGDALKRMPLGFAADLPHAADIKRKSFFLSREGDCSLAMSSHWMDEVQRSYAAARPLLEFLCKATGRKF